jgi:hypothetical protein
MIRPGELTGIPEHGGGRNSPQLVNLRTRGRPDDAIGDPTEEVIYLTLPIITTTLCVA